MRYVVLIAMLFVAEVSAAQSWKEFNDAGMVHYKNGQYVQAEELFIRAIEENAKSPGQNDSAYITTLTNAAYAQQMRADYEKARSNFRKALEVSTRLYPTLHIDRIQAIINLGNSFLPAGLYDSCEVMLLQAQALLGEAVRDGSTHYRESLYQFFDASVNIQNSLASLYHKKGLTHDAIALMSQQREHIRIMYPDNYAVLSIYQNTVSNLATYYMNAGESLHAKAAIEEQVSLSSRHPEKRRDYLQALNNLGSIYRILEQPDSAAYAWKEAIRIIQSGLFSGSDLHVAILNNLGEMQSSGSRYEDALATLNRSLELQEARAALNPRIYQTTLLNLSETLFWMGNLKEADERYQALSRMLIDEIIHNFTYLSDKEKISFYRSNLSILEYFKFFAFDVSGALQPNVGASRYVSEDAAGALFDLLLATKGLILHPGYRLRSSILASQDASLRATYERWEQNKNTYATLARTENPDINELSSLLRQTEDMEKWLRIHSSEFRKGFVMERRTWRDIQRKLLPGEAAVEMVRLVDGLVYGALVLTPETTSGPSLVVVKSTKSLHLENQYYRQYANAIAHQLTDTLSFQVYWKPVLEEIRKQTGGVDTKRIYFSPDGVYNRINLNTLWNPESGRFHIDEMEIFQVTNMKEVLITEAEVNSDGGHSVLLGRPRYYLQQPAQGELPDLAGTEEEVDDIGRLLTTYGWTTTILKHQNADERSIKDVRNPQVLHLATHGFSAKGGDDGSGLVESLLNSGVMLAGAGDKYLASEEDGILTAYEMMNLALDSTRLVVLSACETGLGEFHTGEGIYGLQAALRSAGARSVVMSLWKVDDDATQQLMRTFYRLWLSAGRGDIRAAFQKAQQDLRTVFPHPYHWGAFVMTGN